jgi:hypothetical protein
VSKCLAGAFLQPRETGFYDHEMCVTYCDFKSKMDLNRSGKPALGGDRGYAEILQRYCLGDKGVQ